MSRAAGENIVVNSRVEEAITGPDQDLLREQGYSRVAPTVQPQSPLNDGYHEDGSQKKRGFWNKLMGVITCSKCYLKRYEAVDPALIFPPPTCE